MSETETVNISNSARWIEARTPQLTRILQTLQETNVNHTIGDNVDNLNKIHGVVSSIRGRQEYVRTYLVSIINIELEVKRFLALAISNYKDKIGEAFTTYAELVDRARSYEEKENRLRPYVPEIKEKEEWEGILDQVKSVREVIQLCYNDLDKASMAANLQVAVIKQMILTGEIKIQYDKFSGSELVKNSTMTGTEKAFMDKLPGDGQGSGEFSFG
jgi:hypothetical protein